MVPTMVGMLILTGFFSQGVAIQADLSRDPRLQVPITLSVPAQTVGGILLQISKETDVPLSAEEPYAGDLLVFRCSSVPVYEALQNLASHLNMEWRKENTGYRLIKTGEERKKEEEERARQWFEPYENLQARLRKEVEEEASSTWSEEKVKEELKAAMEDPANWRGPRFLTYRLDEGYKLVRQILLSLEPKDFAELEEWGVIVFSSRPTPMQKPLPKIDSSLLTQFIESAKKQYEEDSKKSPLPPMVPHYIKVVLRIHTWGRIEGSVRLTNSDHILLTKAPFSPEVLGLENIRTPAYPSYIFEGSLTPPSPSNGSQPRGTRLDRPVSLRGHMSALLLGEVYPEALLMVMDKMLKMDQEEPLGWTLGEPLLQIAEQTDVNLLGDLWDAYLSTSSRPRLQGRTGREYLSALSQVLRFTIKEEKNWVSLKALHRAFNRQRQLPRDLLKTLCQQVREQGFLTLDQLAHTATRITLFHRQNEWLSWLMTVATPSPQTGDYRSYPLDPTALEIFRFWGHLNPSQKEALRASTPLPLNSLSPQAKAHLWKLLLKSTPFYDQVYDQVLGAPDLDPTVAFPRGLTDGVLQSEATGGWTLIVRQRVDPNNLPDATMSLCKTLEALKASGLDHEALQKLYDFSHIRYARDRRIRISLGNYPQNWTLVDLPLTFSPPVPFASLPEEVRRLLGGGG